MSLNWLKEVPREDRFAPRVDGLSIVLESQTGEADQATVNDDAMTTGNVVVWSRSTGIKKFITTGVSNTQLQVLAGVTAGIAAAGKALIVSTGRDVANIRALGANSLAVVSQVTSGAAIFNGSTTLNAGATIVGTVESAAASWRNLVLLSGSALQLNYGTTPRNIVSRLSASSAIVYIGNASDTIKIASSNTHLYHRRGSTDYIVWTSASHGAGSGLNADMVDSVHASQFIRSDAADSYTGLLSTQVAQSQQIRFGYGVYQDPKVSFYHGIYEMAHLSWNESAKRVRLENEWSSEALEIYSGISGLIYTSGGTEYKVYHAGNDGPSSGLDADSVDGIAGSSLLRSDADDSYSGKITASNAYRPFYASNTTMSAKILLNHSKSYYWGIGPGTVADGSLRIELCNNTGGWRADRCGLEIGDGGSFVSLSNARKGSGYASMGMIFGDPGSSTADHRFYVGNDTWNDTTMYIYDDGTGIHKRVTAKNLVVNPSNMYTWVNGTYKLYVFGSSYSTGSWSGSDIRRKKNVKTFNIESVSSKIAQLRPVSFEWRKSYVDEPGVKFGLIAQEVEKIFPNLVETDDEGYKAVAYDKVALYNMMAIREMYKKLQAAGILD